MIKPHRTESVRFLLLYYKFENDLNDEDYGNPDGKGLVFCLMSENFHTKNCANAATENSGKKQNFFRNTPCSFLGAAFINAEQHKCNEVNR